MRDDDEGVPEVVMNDKAQSFRDLPSVDEVASSLASRFPDLRYLVVPRRPTGTERLSEEELAGLVTRNGLIGVAAV